jgi:ferritin-like metal-binding protein YciE
MAKKLKSLEDLYVDQLKDLYDAEKQLIKALPKMAKAASSKEVKKGFEDHLEVTRKQAERIEEIFSMRDGGKPGGKKCVGMEGLIKEGEEVIEEEMEDDVKDAALIAAAQRVEHYEIAGYGTVRAYAERIGDKKAVKLLDETLQEESRTNEKLTGLAEKHINPRAE